MVNNVLQYVSATACRSDADRGLFVCIARHKQAKMNYSNKTIHQNFELWCLHKIYGHIYNNLRAIITVATLQYKFKPGIQGT